VYWRVQCVNRRVRGLYWRVKYLIRMYEDVITCDWRCVVRGDFTKYGLLILEERC